MSKHTNNACPVRKTSIGGQALMEGIMMRGPKTTAMAVRNPQGEIVLETFPTVGKKRPAILRWPIIRGVVGFIDSMTFGYKCLMRSAEISGLEELEAEMEKEKAEKKAAKKAEKAAKKAAKKGEPAPTAEEAPVPLEAESANQAAAEAASLSSDMPEPDTTPLYSAADVEAMIEAATADTYTADEVAAMVADAVAQERARHRRRPAPRLRPIFRRLWRVGAVVVPLVVLAMLTASTAADNSRQAPAADAVAMTPAAALPVADDADTLHVVELPPVTVTAPRTPAGQKTAAVADASSTDEPTADTPSGQKTAPDIATATTPAATGLQPTPPDGLTICAGTAWAYTMMNWA